MRTQVKNVQIGNHTLTGADMVEGIGVFDETKSYLVDNKVFWKATVYRCILGTTAKEEGDLSGAPDIDATHWIEQTFGGGIDAATHKILDQLVHEIAENNYTEITRVSNRVTNVTIWTTSGKTIKIREFEITRDGNNKVQSIVTKQYNSSGVLVETYTQTITRTSGKVTSISGVMS